MHSSIQRLRHIFMAALSVLAKNQKQAKISTDKRMDKQTMEKSYSGYCSTTESSDLLIHGTQ